MAHNENQERNRNGVGLHTIVQWMRAKNRIESTSRNFYY